MVAFTMGANITYNGKATRPKFVFLYEGAGPLEYKRTRLALRALKTEADYHLLIDWDHTFPPDALIRLAAHDKPFVAANYPPRHGGKNGTAYAGQDQPAAGRGLQSVAAAGLGFALVNPHVFSRTERPWFQSHIGENGTLDCGEDVHFCNQVRKAGIPVFVDHDLIVGHIAESILTMEGLNADVDQPSTGP